MGAGQYIQKDLREPPNYNEAATGLLAPEKGTVALTPAQAPPVRPGQCPQTIGCPQREPGPPQLAQTSP